MIYEKKQWWCWIVTDFKLSINTILVSKGRVWISQSILVLSASPRDKTYCSIFRVTVLSVRTNSVRVFWRLPLWNVLFKFFKCLNQHFERSPQQYFSHFSQPRWISELCQLGWGGGGHLQARQCTRASRCHCFCSYTRSTVRAWLSAYLCV